MLVSYVCFPPLVPISSLLFFLCSLCSTGLYALMHNTVSNIALDLQRHTRSVGQHLKTDRQLNKELQLVRVQDHNRAMQSSD